MKKEELLALVKSQLDAKLAGAESLIKGEYQPIIDAVSALEEMPPSNDEEIIALKAKIAELEASMIAKDEMISSQAAKLVAADERFKSIKGEAQAGDDSIPG